MELRGIYFLLLLTIVSVKAEADPSPAAEATPEPDTRLGRLSTISGQSPCELTNQCCNMDNSQCCLGGQQQQKCYTVFKMKCDNEDKPACRVKSDYHCHPVPITSCRSVTSIETRYFNATECVPKPTKKCFDYQKMVCNKNQVQQTVTFDYISQNVVESANRTETHCLQQKMYNCTDRTYTETTQQRVPRQKTVVESQRRCQMVRVKSPDQQMVVPVTRIVYQNVCYNVPTPQCTQSACSAGSNICPVDSSICSTTDYSTRTVCPQPVASSTGTVGTTGTAGTIGTGVAATLGLTNIGGRASCQTVQTPVCGNPAMCNAPAQQCCVTVNQQVCRQVPVRVVENVSQNIPGQMSWKEECNDYPTEKTVVVYDTVNTPVTKTKKECTPVSKPTCHEYIVPSYEVVDQEKSQDIPISISECQLKTEDDQHCITINEYECKETTFSQRFKVTKQVCDVTTNQQQCSNLPVTECYIGQTANCKMVPEQVCQDTCSNSQMCNTCDNFVRGAGFGTCSTSTCANFIPGGNYPGGSGYYPGGETTVGGEGYYTGDQTGSDGVEIVYPGGEGYYPGYTGGEGYYPGYTGGEGYYPGFVGGNGYYPGYTGGEEYYPSGNGGDGIYVNEPGFSRPPYQNRTTKRPYYSGRKGLKVASAVPMNLESAITGEEYKKSE